MISREINVNTCAATATYVPTLLSEIKKVLKPWKTLTELVILGYFSETYFCDKAPSHTHTFSWSIDVCRVWKPKERTKNYSTDLVFIWCTLRVPIINRVQKYRQHQTPERDPFCLRGQPKKNFIFSSKKKVPFISEIFPFWLLSLSLELSSLPTR